MVRFTHITIEFEDGPIHESRSLAEFNGYRFELWNSLAASDTQAYVREWNSHNIAEREWEVLYGLRNRSLEGSCLIFGDRITAGIKLRHPEARAALTHPHTEAKLEINETTGVAYAYISSGEASWALKFYGYSYPISDTLIPRFETMSSSSDLE